MKSKDKMPSLEQQYAQVIKGVPKVWNDDEINLEQPYAGRIVESVTTYSTADEGDDE